MDGQRARYELWLARGDASYVLDWLRQTDAPENILRLQERTVEMLGGYLGHGERTKTDDYAAEAIGL